MGSPRVSLACLAPDIVSSSTSSALPPPHQAPAHPRLRTPSLACLTRRVSPGPGAWDAGWPAVGGGVRAEAHPCPGCVPSTLAGRTCTFRVGKSRGGRGGRAVSPAHYVLTAPSAAAAPGLLLAARVVLPLRLVPGLHPLEVWTCGFWRQRGWGAEPEAPTSACFQSPSAWPSLSLLRLAQGES